MPLQPSFPNSLARAWLGFAFVLCSLCGLVPSCTPAFNLVVPSGQGPLYSATLLTCGVYCNTQHLPHPLCPLPAPCHLDLPPMSQVWLPLPPSLPCPLLILPCAIVHLLHLACPLCLPCLCVLLPTPPCLACLVCVPVFNCLPALPALPPCPLPLYHLLPRCPPLPERGGQEGLGRFLLQPCCGWFCLLACLTCLPLAFWEVGGGGWGMNLCLACLVPPAPVCLCLPGLPFGSLPHLLPPAFIECLTYLPPQAYLTCKFYHHLTCLPTTPPPPTCHLGGWVRWFGDLGMGDAYYLTGHHLPHTLYLQKKNIDLCHPLLLPYLPDWIWTGFFGLLASILSL